MKQPQPQQPRPMAQTGFHQYRGPQPQRPPANQLWEPNPNDGYVNAPPMNQGPQQGSRNQRDQFNAPQMNQGPQQGSRNQRDQFDATPPRAQNFGQAQQFRNNQQAPSYNPSPMAPDGAYPHGSQPGYNSGRPVAPPPKQKRNPNRRPRTPEPVVGAQLGES